MDPREVLEFIKALVLQAWAYDGVKVIVAHTVVNVVVALAANARAGTFELGKVGEFLIHKLAPYIGVYFVVKAAGEAAGIVFLAPIAWAAIEATLTGDLLDNWTKLGLPLPDSIRRFVVKR